MPNEKTDPRGFNTEQSDVQRTQNAQGGPATGIGDAHTRAVPSPYEEDTATRMAAASTDNSEAARRQREQQKQQEQEQQQTPQRSGEGIPDELDSDGNLQLPEGK